MVWVSILRKGTWDMGTSTLKPEPLVDTHPERNPERTPQKSHELTFKRTSYTLRLNIARKAFHSMVSRPQKLEYMSP